jgi:hypothetical protein
VVGFDRGPRTLIWSVLSIDGNTKRPLGSFRPSTDFGFQLPFFDQYTQSTKLWSADSKRLVYSGQSGATQTTVGGQAGQVLVLDADGLNPAVPVADGGMAVWSP